MSDLVTVSRIASMVGALTSDADLKAVVREVDKRASKLAGMRASGFKHGDRVSYRSKGRTIPGTVERVEGANVIVKMDHGFAARIRPCDLSLLACQRKKLSA
jgi:hypothetical protein